MNKIYVIPLDHPEILALWLQSGRYMDCRLVECPCGGSEALSDFVKAIASTCGGLVAIYSCSVLTEEKHYVSSTNSQEDLIRKG